MTDDPRLPKRIAQWCQAYDETQAEYALACDEAEAENRGLDSQTLWDHDDALADLAHSARSIFEDLWT